MKNLLLILIFLSSFSYADCTSSNLGVYDSKGVLISSHAQTYKAIEAAINLSKDKGEGRVKTPDIVCTAKLSSSSSSRSSSVASSETISSVRSSAASSAASSATGSLVAYDNFDGSASGISWPGGVFAGVSPSPASLTLVPA